MCCGIASTAAPRFIQALAPLPILRLLVAVILPTAPNNLMLK
jgi:hypothetical protein